MTASDTRVERPLAVVTGASAGIGAEIARCAAADGYDVVLVARRAAALEALAAELIENHGAQAWSLALDLTEDDAPARLAQDIEALQRPVHVLVNNAGCGSQGAFVQSTSARELGQVKLNVLALVDCTQRLLPGMLARREGHILNMGSIAGFQPGPYMATYCATKAFVNHWSEALAFELKDSGVTVTVHCPGPTQTEFGSIAGNERTLAFQRMPPVAARDVARHAWKSALGGEVMVVHGFSKKLAVFGVRCLPRSVIRKLAARFNSLA